MSIVRLIHRWIGLFIAIPIALVAASGGLLLFRDTYYRVRWPAVATAPASDQAALRPAVLRQIEALYRGQVRAVKFPRAGVNAFHVYLVNTGEALVDPRTGAVIASWRADDDVAAFMFDLHAHLLAGAGGELVNGYLALIAVFMGMTGVVLWFPRRAGVFRLRYAVPASTSPSAIFRSHAASGVLVLAGVVFFSATGAALVFYEPLGQVAGNLLDTSRAETPTAMVTPGGGARVEWTEILRHVDETLPAAGPAMYYPGNERNAVLTFRKSLPGEWHPNGRSYVLVDPYTGAVVQSIDARAQGRGTRAMHAVYPLHSAKTGGWLLLSSAIVSAAGLAWLALTGAWTQLGNMARQRRQRAARASTSSVSVRDY